MSIISDYKNKNIMSPGLTSLYTSKTLVLVASGFIGLFLPVFLMLKYQSLEKAIVFYLVSWILYLFLVAPGAKLMNKLGIKASLILSMPFLALFYVCLFLFDYNILVFSVLAVLTLTFYRMFYWVPYHTEFAKLSEKSNRGKQIGILESVSSFLGIIIPVTSGFLIAKFGFNLVFVIVIVLILSAILPLMSLPKIKERFTWSYLKTWQEFFKKKNRRMFITYMSEGAENWIGGVLWPIFIWQVLNGEYLAVGAVSSIIILVTVILKLIMGDYTDKFNKRKLIRVGSIFYSIGWIFKIFITTAFQIFIAATYHNFALILLRTPFNALMYEKAADSGHYVDEYSTLREMYHQFGRAVIIVIVLIMLKFLPLNIIFILAAVSALMFNLIPHGVWKKDEVILNK